MLKSRVQLFLEAACVNGEAMNLRRAQTVLNSSAGQADCRKNAAEKGGYRSAGSGTHSSNQLEVKLQRKLDFSRIVGSVDESRYLAESCGVTQVRAAGICKLRCVS